MNPPDDLPRRLVQAFEAAHGAPPTLLVQAPGRVNLIGEHTDYNDGFVLPCALAHRTLVAIRPRADAQVRVLALDLGEAQDRFFVDRPIGHDHGQPWTSYVRGVFHVLAARGLPLRGADLAISGDVPRGAGLSSSASLEVAVALALQQLHGFLQLTPTDLALIAQQAENDFAGCQCGIMDQLISARAQAGHALLIDCRSLHTRAVPVPEGVAVMVVHSRVQRGLVESAYNLRRQQCQAAAAALGAPALRDVGLAQLLAARGAMDDETFRRARHVVSENQRTLAAADALAGADLPAMGRLMAASHASMQADFEITVPAVDQLVALLQEAIGPEGGARMTGGGFGGCVVALMPTERVDAVCERVARGYRAPNGQPATVWVTRPAGGAAALGAPI